MMWDQLVWFGSAASLLWIVAAAVSFMPDRAYFTAAGKRYGFRRILAVLLNLAGSLVFLSFITGLWISLERPPMRTVGETRLWYSLFLSVSGTVVYMRWRYRWILPFSAMMSVVFVCINLFRPEIHDKSLMPALQSVWFVPHVVVYMFAYALLGAVTLFALYLWLRPGKKPSDDEMGLCDNLVRIGWAFLTMGMVMGALWAKQAWGDWWTWDPKETWAAATWLSYLTYLHLRKSGSAMHGSDRRGRTDYDLLFALLVFSFILLQMCWYGINYLPAAQGASVHIYG